MKKFILFSLLAICSNYLFAQTNGGNNNNGKAPPSYQNPYRNNPYGNNPYGSNGTGNIFNKNDKKDEKKQDNNVNQRTNTEEQNKKRNLDFSDRNTRDQGKSDAELRAQYKNDPDYLKYIGIQPYGSDFVDTAVATKELDENDVYGSNFLANNSAGYGSSSLTSVPEDYRLGVGDEIVVSVWGASEFQSPFTISKDGSIFPNQVGKIFLQGLSFQAARSVIRSKFKRVLPSGSNVDIVLGKVRTIRVYVNDEVKKPGMITMSALNTPINALQIAGGLTDYGNMRDIQIRRNGIVIDRIDLYEYIRNGGNSGFYLEDNDVISVGLYDKIVTARGSFKRPMRYQMTKNGTLTDLLELAGGASSDARESLIRIKTVYNEQEQFIDINGKDFLSDQDYLLRDGDVVNINPINKGVSNVVTVEGAIPYPDQYQIKNNERIFDLIKRAGGLTSDAYKPRAFVFRQGNTTDKSKALKVNIADYGNDNSPENILLESGDVVRVLSESRFDENFYVEVKGLVRNPGKQLFKPNLKLKDLLLMAGGLKLDAESGRIEISNVTDTITRYSITGNNVNVRVVSINPDLSIDKISENLTIKPFDIIYVRRKKENIEQQNVIVFGEVDYPGPYSLLGNRERITSILRRTGGLTRDAFPEGAKLYRENIGPVVINLKDAMRHAGGKDDIILENGDTIIIPKQSDVVRVEGEVQTPVNIKFDRENRSVMNYIDAAGGFGERPWRKRISVKYQNGRKKRTKNFMFFKFYPKVKPGSVVTVPTRPEREKFDLNAALQYGLTSITSVVTIVLLLRSTQ